MRSLIEFLRGKKTYITAIVFGIVAAAKVLEYDVPPGLLEFLGAVGVITIRAGIKKAE